MNNNESVLQKMCKENQLFKVSDIENIRSWVKSQAHLPSDFIDDVDLISAHHCCEWDCEITNKVLDLNFTLRTLFNFYQNRICDDSLEKALQVWLITPIQAYTKKGNRAIYCKLLDPDASKFVYADVVKAFVMIMDLWQYEEGPFAGVAVIVDMDRVCMGHLTRIDLTVAQQFFYFLQEAMFIRLREFHFTNAPIFMDILMGMVRPFFKKEMLEMLTIHAVGSNTLNDCLPVNALPVNDDIIRARDDVWNKLKKNNLFFDKESKKRVNENERIGGQKTISSYFNGQEESFRMLDID